MLVLLGLASAALAQAGDPASTHSDSNVYVAGGVVSLGRRVGGDLIAAGGKISVDHEIKGDAALVGGTICVDAPLGGDLRGAGGNIDIHGSISGEALGVGGNIEFASSAQVAERVWLAGGHVRLAGKMQGDVTIYAQQISVSGDISGNARLADESIEILPGARIGGMPMYSSPNSIVTDPTATLSGGLVREAMPHVQQPNRLWRVGGWLLGIASDIGVFAIGVLLILLFPRLSIAVEQVVTGSPWRSLALGLGISMAIPVAAMILLITIIGIP